MSQKRYLQIADFDAAQMYKDRNPIWIKLHCAILDDYEFCAISDETKFHAVALMLLAARLNNKLPDDEVWLRRKINANSEINLKLLLEIGFLTAIKGARNSFNARKANNLKGEFGEQSENQNEAASPRTDENRTEQNRNEENKTEHNTTEASAANGEEAEAVVAGDFVKFSKTGAGDKAAEVFENSKKGSSNGADSNGSGGSGDGGHLSQFSIEECLKYVERCRANGDNIRNPQGLATTLYRTGKSDAFIRAALYPEDAAEAEKIKYGPAVVFTDEPCTICFSAKMADAGGKGFRKCEHCRDERGKSTGFEPTGRN